jgi:Fic family protein
MPKKYPYPVNPDRTQPWNELLDLPISEQLFEDLDIYKQLGRAKEALALLNGRSIAIPNQGVLINAITLQEAKDSSAIENIFTTEDELYKAYSENENNRPVKGTAKEVLRYREALWQGYHYLNKHGYFTTEYFLKVFNEIKETTEGFRSPASRVYIRMGGSGPNAGKPVYTPPRGIGVIEQKMENLINFLNGAMDVPNEPLLKLAIAHYQFEVIHPFTDGNGRTGRIMMINYLCNEGLLDYPILFLSRYIMEHKQEYYDLLAGVSQQGAWKNWILFILRAVEYTSQLTFDKISDIIAVKEDMLEMIKERTEIRRPDDLVQAIFTQPFTKVSHLTDAGIYAENTARSYLTTLVEFRLLEKREIRGKHYFLNTELKRILSY